MQGLGRILKFGLMLIASPVLLPLAGVLGGIAIYYENKLNHHRCGRGEQDMGTCQRDAAYVRGAAAPAQAPADDTLRAEPSPSG